MAVPRVVCGATDVGCLVIWAVVVVVFAGVAPANEKPDEGAAAAVEGAAATAGAPSVKPADVVAVPKLNPVDAGVTDVVGATVNPVDADGVVIEGVVVQLRPPPRRKPLVFVVVVVVPVTLNAAE